LIGDVTQFEKVAWGWKGCGRETGVVIKLGSGGGKVNVSG